MVTDLDGETVTAQEIVETANTMTMFASTRVLTVKNYQPLIKKSSVTETDSDSRVSQQPKSIDDSLILSGATCEPWQEGEVKCFC